MVKKMVVDAGLKKVVEAETEQINAGIQIREGNKRLGENKNGLGSEIRYGEHV